MQTLLIFTHNNYPKNQFWRFKWGKSPVSKNKVQRTKSIQIIMKCSLFFIMRDDHHLFVILCTTVTIIYLLHHKTISTTNN